MSIKIYIKYFPFECYKYMTILVLNEQLKLFFTIYMVQINMYNYLVLYMK